MADMYNFKKYRGQMTIKTFSKKMLYVKLKIFNVHAWFCAVHILNSKTIIPRIFFSFTNFKYSKFGRSNFTLFWDCSNNLVFMQIRCFTSMSCYFTDFRTLGAIPSTCSSCDCHKILCSRSKILDDSSVWLSIYGKATRIPWSCFVRIANLICYQYTIPWTSRRSSPGYCYLVLATLV